MLRVLRGIGAEHSYFEQLVSLYGILMKKE